jgi:hypothetical protein
MSTKRKGVTKGDMVKALNDHDIAMQNMYKHILLIDDVLANYIKMNKDEDNLSGFMNPKTKEEDGKPKQPKRKQSRRSTTTSK